MTEVISRQLVDRIDGKRDIEETAGRDRPERWRCRAMSDGDEVARRLVPAGTPIGPALAIPIGRANDVLRDVLFAIDAVHGDGRLPPIRVVRRVLPPGEEGFYEPSIGEIVVSRSASAPALTLLHEIGHVLDRHGLGDGDILGSSGDTVLSSWRSSVDATWSIAALDRLIGTQPSSRFVAHLAYLRQYDELWARSYTQYVVSRRDRSPLVDALHRRRRRAIGRVNVPYYWGAEDFRPVAHAIDDAFRRRGWIQQPSASQSTS